MGHKVLTGVLIANPDMSQSLGAASMPASADDSHLSFSGGEWRLAGQDAKQAADTRTAIIDQFLAAECVKLLPLKGFLS